MNILILLVTLFAAGPPVEADAYPAPDRRESYLREQLWEFSREVDLGGAISEWYAVSLAAVNEIEAARWEGKTFVGPVRPPSVAMRRLAASDGRLRGLRFLPDSQAELSQTARYSLYNVSVQARSIGGYGFGAHHTMVALFDQVISDRREWAKVVGPRLEQVAMVHEARTREALVTALRKSGSPESYQTLARRATFDLSQDVRRAAREALRDVDPLHTRPIFLTALRHPWPPAAD